LLQAFERLLLSFAPSPYYVLLGKLCEWSGDVGVILDKRSVEVRESQEGLDVFYVPWYCLFFDSADLFFADLDSVDSHSVS
jgi:hypothetical protein